jgi:hypothetical protein
VCLLIGYETLYSSSCCSRLVSVTALTSLISYVCDGVSEAHVPVYLLRPYFARSRKSNDYEHGLLLIASKGFIVSRQ